MSNARQQLQTTGHRYALKRLSSYMDGQLSDPERARMEAHLAACPDCRDELHTLRWTQDLARQMPAMPVPRSFIVREADLETRGIVQPQFRLARSLAGLQTAAAIVAVLLVLVVAGDVFVGQGSRRMPIEAALPETAAAPLAFAPTREPGAAADEPRLESDKKQIDSGAAPTATPAAAMAMQALEPTAAPLLEPSPTRPARPTGTPTPAGNTAQVSSNETPMRLLTETATTAPTQTQAAAPTPTAEPTQTAAPPAAPTLTPIVEPQISESLPESTVWQEAEIENRGALKEGTRLVGQKSPGPAWRLIQIGLGVVLAGLLIAIIWLRRWGRLS